MRRFFHGVAILLAAGSLWAEDSLRLPPSATAEQMRTLGDQVELKWHYGTITMPAPATPPAEPAASAKPAHPRAWNRGIFNLRYELARDGEFLRARKVRVTVDNKTHFREEQSESLKAHEAMHRRINETEARRIEKTLSAFQYKSTGSPADLKRANARFRREFRERVKEVDLLHKEWDKNQIP